MWSNKSSCKLGILILKLKPNQWTPYSRIHSLRTQMQNWRCLRWVDYLAEIGHFVYVYMCIQCLAFLWNWSVENISNTIRSNISLSEYDFKLLLPSLVIMWTVISADTLRYKQGIYCRQNNVVKHIENNKVSYIFVVSCR